LSRSLATAAPLAELRRWLSSHRAAAAYITCPVSIAYLTGFYAETMERLMALVVRPDSATLIVPALEDQNATAHAQSIEVASWRDGEDAYALVSKALVGCEEIGVEKEHLSVAAAEALTSRTGAHELVDVGPEIRRLRLIKDDTEVEKLMRAAGITDAAGTLVFSFMRAGQSELEIALMLGTAVAELGGQLSFETLVQSGPNSALPHLHPTSRRLASGDLVLLDFGAAIEGYKADTTRMAVVGEPSARHSKIHQLVLEAHDAAIEAVRPGVTTGDIDATARRVIESAGHGEQFFHRTGHGLGLEAHEDPSLDPGSRVVLEEGMVFTIEPGIYIPGWGGVRIEDDVVVERDGCRLLTKADRSLQAIKAD
jgi:Xaa-Pro dipeptidase